MADITYSKPTWANGGTPAISATNLQAISDAIDAIAHEANRGSAILSADQVNGSNVFTTSGAGGSDGNSGQPPSPKPRSATDSDIGQWVKKSASTGTSLSLPAGGSWAYWIQGFTSATLALSYFTGGVSAGGTEIGPAVAGREYGAICWRVA